MRSSIQDFFSKCHSHLLKKSLMENFIFCTVRRNVPTTFRIALICKWDFFMEIVLTLEHINYNDHVIYGYSFVAKLSFWKKNFFLKKTFVFFTKYTLFAEKKYFYKEKKFEKNFFCREKYKWKCKKYISHLKKIFLHRK